MDLQTACLRVKSALSNRDFIAALTHYHLRNGRVYANNGAMTASAPIDEQLEHVVPADELDKAFQILGPSSMFTWSEDLLTVKNGRKRITISLLKPEQVVITEPVTTAQAVPEGFKDSIKKIRPFISSDASRPWSLVGWLHLGPNGKHVWTATNNITVIEVDCGIFNPEVNVQIPNFALDFILGAEELVTSIGIEETKVTFYFADQSQLTTQLFTVKMPEQASQIVKDSYELLPDTFHLAEDWKQAYQSIVQLDTEEVVFTSEALIARRRQAEMVVDIPCPMPRDSTKQQSLWNPKFLTPVVDVATHIDFGEWPKPVKFFGNGLRGLTVGKVI